MPATRARVGIVLRTRNRAWFLARALADISAQSFVDWRLHIVNDGGDRATVDDAVSALARDFRDRIRVTHCDDNVGRSAAANIGVRGLDTDYIVLHDDDDLWHPDFLRRTTMWLDEHPDDVGVVVRTEIVFEEAAGEDSYVETSREVFWRDIDEIFYSDLLQVNRWVPISYLYRRELHDLVGPYDEQIHAAEDWDFGLRTTARHHVGFLDGRPLAFWTHRRAATGDVGNSMFELAGDHTRFDAAIRDAALRDYVAQQGPGLPLYLTKFISDTIRDAVGSQVREELARLLDERPSDLDRIKAKLRRLLGRGRRA